MIDWETIDTVFLDMDGTLLDLRFDNHFWLEHVPLRFAERHGISIEQARAELFPKMRDLRGQLDWYCTTFWSKELDLPIIELKREVSHLIKSRAQVEPFLKYLREMGKQIVLFTNAHEDTLALKMEKTGLTPAFDKTITSHSLGHAKEVEAAWEVLGSVYDFDPTRSVFIDDSFSVLDSARAYGISSLFGIACPDSTGDKLSHQTYILLESFEQIMPEKEGVG
jgi:putative hydrolase of the HAD superfamily